MNENMNQLGNKMNANVTINRSNEKWNTKPEKNSNEELLDSYQCLYDEHQSLIMEKLLVDTELEQLKLQQFYPITLAAPDLLEALIEVMHKWEYGELADASGTFQKALVVIAKATGGLSEQRTD